MQKLFCVFLAVAGIAAANTITGTYDIDTIDGSATTFSGGVYDLSSTGVSTYSLLTFTPDAGQDFLFSGLTNLDLSYTAIAGGIAGGAPRIEVDFTNGDSLLALLGPAGTFADPTLGAGDSGNLIAQDDTGRYDLSQGGLGGSGYTNYDAALAAAGVLHVSSFTVIVDSGWATSGNVQDFQLGSNALTVEANLATPEPSMIWFVGFGLFGLAIYRWKRPAGTSV